MVKCHFSTMCIICTVVSVVSVSILIGLWTFQFLSFVDHSRSQKAPPDSCHLPECPISYHVTLWPRLKVNPKGRCIFTGNSSVVFECGKETDMILIHINKLNLTAGATLSTLTGSPAPSIMSTHTSRKTQHLTFHLSEKLKAGEFYRLYIEFVGELSDNLRGLYRIEYDKNGVKQIVTSSQLRILHKCGIFPCFPELNAKPVFHITLLQEPGTFIFSNRTKKRTEHVHTLNNPVTFKH